uniref:Ubiquitin-like protease family profile domain-containing protein n=1 Tax=Brassica oleracea var. oleracea TaxID=109376 RepID=A0A0D3C3D9_BRAOL
MQEFHAITGLKYKDDEPDLDIDNWRGDKGFWSKLLRRKGKISLQQIRKVHLKSCNTWSHVDRLRMVYLCVIAGLVMVKDEKVCIPHKYIKLVMDFDKMRKYPWGLHSFDALVTSITEARDKVKTQNSYVIDGFSYALQIWLMEAIPDIGSLLGKKLKEGITSMRCRNWKGYAKVSYEDIISIESDFASTGVVFPYISSTGNGNIIVDVGFERDDEMNDERVDLIIDMYRKKYDWSKHTHGAAPAYTQTHAAATTSTQAHGSDSTISPTPTPASTHASAPATTSRARASRNKASVPSHTGGPATAAKTRSQTKDPELSDVFGSLFDTLDFNLGTQEHLQKTMGNLIQESHVKGFDPSQEIFIRPFLNDIDDPEVRCKDSDYELVFVLEDKFSKLTEWILKRKVLQIGPSKFDAELVSRIMGPNEWLKNNVRHGRHDVFVSGKTSLRRWKPNQVAFMNCMFSNQIITAFVKFDGNRRAYKVDNNLLEYGRGELPYHGSTCSVWSVDVDRLYIPICVNQIHWISMCVNHVNRTVEVFDCGGKKNNKAVEAFVVLIPRIVKAVQSSDKKKDFNVKQYVVSYVPMRALNTSGNDCGAYSLKFIESHLLGLDFSLVNNENIQEARHKIAFDLWEAANDEALQYRMSIFKPPKRAPEKTVELF